MTEPVKQGWSWPAFFFNSIWAMVKKMWLLGSLVLISALILYAIFGSVGHPFSIADLLNLGLSVVFGIYGNSWREASLLSRGFKLAGTVTAASSEGALALHVSGVGR
jgi:hypothetical protein